MAKGTYSRGLSCSKFQSSSEGQSFGGRSIFGLDGHLFEDRRLLTSASVITCSHRFLLKLFRQAPCDEWSHEPHFENVITASVQPNGEILVNNVRYCLTIQTGNKLRALGNSNAECRESKSRFRVVG